MNAELRDGLGSILKPEQIRRYDQIQLQSMGFNAFATPRVEGSLNLTNEQKTRIVKVLEEQNQAMRAAAVTLQNDREGTQAKARSIRQQGIEKILVALTES